MAERLAAQSPTAQDVRAFGRLLYAQSQSVELDGQGRFRVPSELAGHAELGRDCVLIGVGDHVELWDKGRWEAYLTGLQPRYDQLAESALAGVAPVQPPPAGSTVSHWTTVEQVARPMQPR